MDAPGDLEGGKLQLADIQADGSRRRSSSTAERSGKLDFKVPFGPAGMRRIVATVTGADGIPRATSRPEAISRPSRSSPAPPRDVRVQLQQEVRAADLLAGAAARIPSGGRTTGTTRWRSPTGVSSTSRAKGSKKVKVRGVADDSRYRVSVFGIENEGLQGKARTEKGEA